MKELRRSLGARGHARLALEHGLYGLGPARRAQRLGVVDGGATAGRAGLEVDAQLELARHAHAVGRHDRQPREQRGVEEPRARAGPALLLAQLSESSPAPRI